MMATETGYNGWKNYETWNVALWVQNDEALYHFARERGFMGWDRFAQELMEAWGGETPDGVSWDSGELDTDELDDMLSELAS